MPADADASSAAARDAPTTTTTRNSNARSNSATTTTPRGATATRAPRPSASERAEAVRMRARAIAEEDRARRAAKVRAKDDKIATIAARREREGAHASSTGTVAVADATRASPVKRAKTSNGAVKGGERAAWVDANGFASAEGSEEEFHDAEDEEEVAARTVRAVTRGIVDRVIEDAERERGVRACVETAVASVVKANANARFERTPKKSTGEGLKKAFSFLKTPKSAGSRTKSMTTPASASASTPASTPKPKSAMEVKLSDALSAARAQGEGNRRRTRGQPASLALQAAHEGWRAGTSHSKTSRRGRSIVQAHEAQRDQARGARDGEESHRRRRRRPRFRCLGSRLASRSRSVILRPSHLTQRSRARFSTITPTALVAVTNP